MENRTTKTAETVAWDGVVKGLGLRTRGQRGTWIIQTRIDGRRVKRTLGDHDALSRPQARDAARQLLTDLTASVPKQRFLDVTVAEFGKR